ncbi:hypothetical protein SRB5_64330 [Streptomyces sp. RB5]|uniref:Glycosyltransferase family 29 (Sialyltransferase) n=1 Tax=Streptomyces smaragdinus TaxID=2585196 RepID=A0A7K0CRW0_9ACTN|nr:glycosyltransferase family 29 protein [Streptomyces smaragdinus]MQY16235.1 hypothetical protein [Streptomyces smaragdinus]
MAKVSLWLERKRLIPRPRPAELDQSVTLAECVRACAQHEIKLNKNLNFRKNRLADAIRSLMVAYAAGMADSSKSRAVASGRSTWAHKTPELLNALIVVGDKAIDVKEPDELRLALLITDTVLGAKPTSRIGWRLRASVLETMGDDEGAIGAHQRYLDLTPADARGTDAKIARLRDSGERLEAMLRLLQDEYPTSRELASGRGADSPDAELWAEGLALVEAGQRDRALPYLVASLVVMNEQGRPAPQIRSALTDLLDLGPLAADSGLAAARPLIRLYAEDRRLRTLDPAPDPLLGGTEVLSLGDFRNQITGKSICLVANSQRVAKSGAGAEIDSYDLVVRFNSFKLDAPNTGTKTDIHATIHLHNFNWAHKVTTRLVFSGTYHGWKQSLRRRLVPGAQQYVNDGQLRWPVRDIGKLGEADWPPIPTSGFNMLWLLDFLNVSPKLDLFGFDFYETGAYRLPEAMKLPVTAVHGYQLEKEWVMARATDVTENRISLR